MLVIGLICNYLIKPVDPKWHMSDAEVAKLQEATATAGAGPSGSFGIGKGSLDGKAALFWLFVGIPLLITIGIFLAIYLPGVVRGESVAPAGARADDQWLGGRRDTAQLEAASTKPQDTDGEAGSDRDTGGAGGTW